MAERHGFDRVDRTMVGKHMCVSPSLLSRYFTARRWRAALITAAVERQNLRVLAQGLAVRHPVALAAPPSLRRRAALFIAGE